MAVTRLVLAAWAAGLALSGCGPTAEDDVSVTQHTVDRPVRGTEAWQWAAASDADYTGIMAPLIRITPSKLLPSSHALVQRTQLWVDRIDASLRAAHPDQLANVPKPVARVVKTSPGSINAFVAPLPVCYKLPVRVAPGTATAASTAEAVYLDAATGELSEWPAELKCKAGTDAVQTLSSFAARFNSMSTGCKLSVTGQGVLQGSAACGVADDLAGIVAAKSVVLLQTANAITVHTALFPAMSEQQFVGILAHELGHYYRAHANAHESEFDYFYTMGQQNGVTKPAAEPALAAIGQRAVAASQLLSMSDAFETVPQQKVRPELFFALGSIVRAVCSEGNCSEVCKTAQTAGQHAALTPVIGRYPLTRETTGLDAGYLAFEAKALACVDTIKLATTAGTLNSTSLSFDVVKDLVESPVWPSWVGQLPASAKRGLASALQLVSQRLGSQAPATTSLGVAMRSLSKTLSDQDTAGETALKAAYDGRVGQYTVEQEADDESAEWMTDIGLDPKHMVDAMATFAKGDPTSLRGMLLGENDCKTLRDAGWMGADGTYAFVPVGDYSEIHHSSCYRMFNLEREIAAHGYVPASVQLPPLGGSAWQSLQTTAKTLSAAEAGGPGGGSGVLPLVKRLPTSTCTYAQSRFL